MTDLGLSPEDPMKKIRVDLKNSNQMIESELDAIKKKKINTYTTPLFAHYSFSKIAKIDKDNPGLLERILMEK